MNLAVKYSILENGDIIDMGRAKLSRNRALSKLKDAFSSVVEDPCEVFQEQTYRWKEDTAPYRQPDISIVCDASSENGLDIDNAPWFILEALSKSTEKIDKTEKMELYAKVGVQEYWLLDPDTLLAECYINKGGTFAFAKNINIREAESISFLTKEDVVINVSKIK